MPNYKIKQDADNLADFIGNGYWPAGAMYLFCKPH